MVCTEESPSGSDPNSQAVTISPAKGTTNEEFRREKKQMGPDGGAHISQSDCEVANPSTTPPKTAKGSYRDSSLVQPAQEGKSSSVSSEKALPVTPKGALSLPSTQGGSASSGKAEKASEDGFNWRKYGQKNVKGNEFIRSYYKCTHPNCPVKKQVERSLEGQITDTVYFGQHEHPKPHVNVPLAIGLVLSIVEEKPEKHPSTVIEEKPCEVRSQTFHHVKTTDTPVSPMVTASSDVKSMVLLSPRSRLRNEIDNDDDPSSKRKKKENRVVDANAVDKATGEARHIIQTTSEVDIVNDGYRWRKYGQKLVKGNPNPRSYYRCSSPGCPVKKHVERASHDPKVVMTTYEGQHDHDMPAARTVTRNPGGNGAIVAQNDESRTKSDEVEAVSTDAAVREECSERPSKLPELRNGKSESKCAATTTPERESKSNEQQKGETSSHSKSKGETGSPPTNPVPQSRLAEEQPKSQLTAKPEESEGVCLNKVGKKSSEQQQQQVLNTAAAVQS